MIVTVVTMENNEIPQGIQQYNNNKEDNEKYSDILSGDFLKKFTPADILDESDSTDLNNDIKNFILNEENKQDIILKNIFSIIDSYTIIDSNGNTIAKDIEYYNLLNINIVLFFSGNEIYYNNIRNIVSHHFNKIKGNI